MSKKVW